MINHEHIQALKAAEKIISEMKSIRRNGQCSLALFTWEEFDALLADRDADKALIAEQAKRITELEARAVTVKLPDSVIDAICLTAAEIHNLGRGVSDNRAQEIINSIRCAAGITLDVGE